jgi:hypothetical protein
MNPFLNLLFLFLFILAVFYFVVDVNNQYYLRDKLVIFIAMFFFQFVLTLISKIINKCKIELYEVVNDCLRTAFVGVIGYSVYTDLTLMEDYKDIFEPDPLNKHKAVWMVSITIILLMTLTKTVQLLLQTKESC